MADFVEREKILALQTDLHFDNIEQLKHWKCRHIDPIDVELLPAADVRPVVRAKWKLVDAAEGERNDTLMIMWGCTHCGQEFKTSGRMDFEFCPNCGADMRAEEGGAT